MATNTLMSNVSNALEKVIQPFIQDNFNRSTPLLDQLKRNDAVEFMNDAFYSPVRSSRHGGIANLANDGNSLVSGNASIAQANVGYKILTGTFTISKVVMDATKTRKGAVENMLTFQARTLSSDFSKDVNRQYYSDGIGVIAQVAGSTGAGTLTVTLPDSNLDDGRSIDNYGTVNGDISPTKYIQPGMILGIGTAANDLGTVSSITGNTVVVTGSPAIVANDAIYRVDGTGEGAGTAEIQGIRAALSTSTGTSTYAGLARSNSSWTPQVGTVSEALTVTKMEDKYLAAREFSMTGDRYAIFVNRTLYKKYGDLLTALRRTVNETELLGGWSGLEFQVGGGKVGVFLDYEVPDGEVEIVNLDSWTVCEIAPMAWMENPDGGGLLRTRTSLLYEATMAWFTNLLCRAPGANGRLTQKTG